MRLDGRLVPSAVLVAVALSLPGGVLADDRDLLRAEAGHPFVFLLLDTSGSMALDFEGEWVHAGADDPRSRLHATKAVLHDLVQDLPGVHFGFAHFNKDRLRVSGKHWLYYVADTPANAAVLETFPVRYPEIEPGNEVEVAEIDTAGLPTGFSRVEIDGDMLTLGPELGRRLVAAGVRAPTTVANALDLDAEREKANRYPKLGHPGDPSITSLYVESFGAVYRLEVRHASHPFVPDSERTGQGSIPVTFTWSNAVGVQVAEGTLELRLWRPFLFQSDGGGRRPPSFGGCGVPEPGRAEPIGGFWGEVGFVEGDSTCGDPASHSGRGWEGNYDTGFPFAPDPSVELGQTGWNPSRVDTSCDPATMTCSNLMVEVSHSERGDGGARLAELDRGDVLPFHWSFDNRDELLSRLAPNHGSGPPDFGVASYFEDEPDGGTGRVGLAPGRRPLLAFGKSGVADAALDLRCWYEGNDSPGCGLRTSEMYRHGFSELLEEADPALFGCRRPSVIVLSDLGSNCDSSSGLVDVLGSWTAAGDDDVDVRSWLLNLGPRPCTGFPAGGGTRVIGVRSREALREELEGILGRIVESRRTFTSPAVSGAGAGGADVTYFSSFVPLREDPVWPGRIQAFRRPVPLDRSVDPPVPNVLAAAWDAGEVLATRQAPERDDIDARDGTSARELRLGFDGRTRRVFYGMRWNGSDVPSSLAAIDRRPLPRQLFGPANVVAPPPGADTNDVRRDLWSGMGVPTMFRGTVLSNDPESLGDLFARHPAVARDAHTVFRETYGIRSVTVGGAEGGADEELRYVLGDVFHSRPLLLGAPRTAAYFGRPDEFPGYDQFAAFHERRRRVLAVGANDGMLHLFDAGVFRRDAGPGNRRFDLGTGTEILAYVPRAQLPAMRSRSRGTTAHQWGVDGSPVAADVRIDVLHDGAPTSSERSWRTVVAVGLRRGGSSYTVLDVTHPDPMEPRYVDTESGDAVFDGFVPVTGEVVPGCLAQSSTGLVADARCDAELTVEETSYAENAATVPYGTPLFEFTDVADDDGDGRPDLGQTWSTPNLGPIRVCTDPSDCSGSTEIRWVMIFGGGLDPSGTLTDPAVAASGDWLYMVDLETGKPIYKRRLSGSAPAAPAAVDTNGDGVLDRVYIGTTAGFLHRVDMSEPALLQPCGGRIASADHCIAGPDEWAPSPFFDTGRRPVFFRPAVIFVADLGRFAVVFGTGDRANLWASAPRGGNRLYAVVDETCRPGEFEGCVVRGSPPLDETALEDVTGRAFPGPDVLSDPMLRGVGEKGWVLRFGVSRGNDRLTDRPEGEMLVSPPVVVSGVLAFSTFLPHVEAGSGLCARRGTSRNYAMLVANGEGLGEELSTPVDGLGTEPFVEATSSDLTEEECSGPQGPACKGESDPCAGHEELTKKLIERIFPESCAFSTARYEDIKTSSSDLEVQCLARLPVCILESSWREF